MDGKERQKEAVKKMVELIKSIEEQNTQRFLFAGILSFTDKIIDEEVAEEIRRRLEMTKVGRIIYEEMVLCQDLVQIKMRGSAS